MHELTMTIKIEAPGLAAAITRLTETLDEGGAILKSVDAPTPAAPMPATAPDTTSTMIRARPPEGAKGLLRLRCKECDDVFGTFLRDYQSKVPCRCGASIDLTAPLAPFRFTCPYCEGEGYGKTNLEDPEITIKCRCGEHITLAWAPKTREYMN